MIARFADAIRTGRILVNAPTAVGALGGVYNALTPTFSLGCGTWGGSTTTDNVNYRNLLNIKTVSRRQAPPQWFRVPSDTYFNAGAIESLRQLPAAQVLHRDRRRHRGAAVSPTRCAATWAPSAVHVFSDVRARADARPRSAPACRCSTELRADLVVAVGGGSVIDAAKAMRLFHEHPQLSLASSTLPFLDARKRVAALPADRPLASAWSPCPTTAGTGSEVSPAAVLTVGGPQGHARRLLARARHGGRRAAPDAQHAARADGRHRRRRAHPRARGLRLDLRLALHRRLLPAGGQPHPRRAAARLRATATTCEARTDMANAATIAGLAFSNAFVGVNHALAHAVGARFGDRARPRQRALPPPRAALQRRDPHEVHAGAGLLGLRRPGEVRADRLGPRPRRPLRGDRARAAVRAASTSSCEAVGMPRTWPTLGIDPEDFGAAIDELARWRPSATRACAPTRACRSSSSCGSCWPRWSSRG